MVYNFYTFKTSLDKSDGSVNFKINLRPLAEIPYRNIIEKVFEKLIT